MSSSESYRLLNEQSEPVTMGHGHSQSVSEDRFYNNPYNNSYPNAYPPVYDSPYVKPPAMTHSGPDGFAPMPPVNVTFDSRTNANRTPSPTPSEARELDNIGKPGGFIDWKRFMTKEYLTSKEGIRNVIIAVVLLVLVIVFVIFHKKIVIALTPATNWCKDQKWGWLIPVAILFVLSFPPLGGHELIGMLCGIGWGLWEGFGIMALGTLLGEIANYFLFKYACTARAQKYQQKSIFYASLSRIVQNGGFQVAVAARYSIIPGHLTTAVFACSGMSFLTFLAAAICSLPKQFATVVIGVLLEDSVNGTSKKETIVSVGVSVITFVITTFAVRYVNKRVDEVKPQIVYERRKARQTANLAKMVSEGHDEDV